MHTTINTNMMYKWPAFLAASCLNSGYMSSYALNKYNTKGHIAMHTIFFKFKTALFFSFLVVRITILNFK